MRIVLAYLDPGSGSLLIQAAIAAAIAVPVIARNRITRGVRAVRSAITRDAREPAIEPVAEPVPETTHPDTTAR